MEGGREVALRTCIGKAWLRRMPLDTAVERLTVEVKRHVNQPNPTLSYVFWNRTRRYVALIPFAMLSGVSCVHTPFLDHRLFDFLAGLPLELVAKNRLHDHAIRIAYPEFADIPFEDKQAARVTQAADVGYHRRTRPDLLRHLAALPPCARIPLRSAPVFARIGLDQVFRADTEPWYLYTLLQVAELERLRCGNDQR